MQETITRPDASVRADAGVRRTETGPQSGFRMELLGLVKFPAGHVGRLHSHPHFELVFIGSGQGRFESAGQALAFLPGSLFLVRPGDLHRFTASSRTPLEMLYLGFSFDALPGIRPLAASRPLPEGPITEWIRDEIRELLPALRNCGEGEPLRAFGVRFLPLLGRVAGLLLQDGLPGGTAAPGPREKLVEKVRQMLLSDLAGPITVPSMARRFHLSPAYFGEVFKRQSGMSLKEYHRNLRLQRASDLLRRTDRTVSAIAADVGMDDIAYFSRSFKRRFGVSPRKARAAPADIPSAEDLLDARVPG